MLNRYSKGTKERENFINLCKDTITGKVTKYGRTVEEANEKIAQVFKELLGTDKLDYKAMRHNPNLGTAFSLIEEVVDLKVEEGFRNNPFFTNFVEFKDMNYGETNLFTLSN